MGYNTNFDTLSDSLSAEVTRVQVLDADLTPNHVLQLGKDWHIKVEWEITDDPGHAPLVPAIGGTWQVRAKLESIGAEWEGMVGAMVPVALVPGQTHYSTTIHGAGFPPAGNDGGYKLLVTINYIYPTGVPGPMAGFLEGPMIQFYP